MNKVFLTGFLAADPIPYTTSNGILQSKITVASNDNRSKNETYFFPCIAWQNNANFINTYLKKGASVAVDGKLTRRSYVSKDGKNVYVTEIIIDNIQTIGNRRENTDPSQNAPEIKINQKTDNFVSIDQAFSESITNNDERVIQKTKLSPFEGDEEIEWITDNKDK